MLCGVDPKSGGTWLGLNVSSGQVVALTNFDDTVHDAVPPVGDGERHLSRGALVSRLLQSLPARRSTDGDADHWPDVEWSRYNGMNLLRANAYEPWALPVAFATNRPVPTGKAASASASVEALASGMSVGEATPADSTPRPIAGAGDGDRGVHGRVTEDAPEAHWTMAPPPLPGSAEAVGASAVGGAAVAFANGWLEAPDTGGPRVMHARAALAALVGRIDATDVTREAGADADEATASAVEAAVGASTATATDPSATPAGSTRASDGNAVTNLTHAAADAMLCSSPRLQALVTGVERAMSARDCDWADDALPPYDDFLPGVYNSKDEWRACGQPFVDFEDWATTSQTLIVAVQGVTGSGDHDASDLPEWLLWAQRPSRPPPAPGVGWQWTAVHVATARGGVASSADT